MTNFDGVKVRVGGSSTIQYQALDHYNSGAVALKPIGYNFNLATANLDLDVDANEIHSDCSSGADILLRGTAKTLYAEASSGSDIEAKELETESCEVRVSSGADVAVNTKKSLTAKASSGGSVKYKGNPEVVSQEKSSGGSVRSL